MIERAFYPHLREISKTKNLGVQKKSLIVRCTLSDKTARVILGCFIFCAGIINFTHSNIFI